jgi:hypothetical protein
MSERTEVEVLVPLEHRPVDEAERKMVLRAAMKSCRELLGPGRILGLVSVASCEHELTGQPAARFRFAVEAPESLQR